MKILVLDLGGRPLTNDDLVVLQGEASAAVSALYAGRGAFIISGCEVTGTGPAYNVSAGIVFIDGEMMRFYGAGAVTLPLQFQRGGFEVLDVRTYQTGGSKTCIRERVAVLAAADPAYAGGEFIPFDTWGGLRWDQVVRASVRCPNEVQPVASVNMAHYDNGLGKPGTEAWGWGLCDGQNGRANLLGNFIVGLDPNRADYDTVGKTGGAASVTLTVPQLPAHGHELSNAASDNTGSTDTGDTYAKSGGSTGHLDQARTALNTGGGQGHENRPPFYVLAMRQWVGY